MEEHQDQDVGQRYQLIAHTASNDKKGWFDRKVIDDITRDWGEDAVSRELITGWDTWWGRYKNLCLLEVVRVDGEPEDVDMSSRIWWEAISCFCTQEMFDEDNMCPACDAQNWDGHETEASFIFTKTVSACSHEWATTTVNMDDAGEAVFTNRCSKCGGVRKLTMPFKTYSDFWKGVEFVLDA